MDQGTQKVKKLALSLIVIGMLLSCKKKQAPPQPPQIAVIFTAVQNLEVNPYNRLVGRVIAPSSVNLEARVEGVIVKQNFTAGQLVKKDDLLFQIEKDLYEIKVKELEAQLAQANSQMKLKTSIFKRMEILNNKKAVAQQEFDTSVSNKDEAIAYVALTEAQLSEAKLKLAWTAINAPFDGRVGITKYTEGNLVSPSTGSILSIIKSDEMEVEFELNEKLFVEARLKEMADTKAGKEKVQKLKLVKTELILPNDSVYPHTGTISFWDNRIDPSTATVKMRALFPNPDHLLIDGMYARLRLSQTISQKALVVAQSAVLQDQAGHYVITVTEDQKAKITRITLDGEHESMYIISEGLKEGDKVITVGLQKVIPGNPVKAVAAQADGNK